VPRPESPLRRDGSSVRELAHWLRDLRNRAGLTYDQLATKTNFSRATLQEALSGKRLPTWQVTRAIVRACGADEELWHSYWAQIKRAIDPDAPSGQTKPITPPWADADASPQQEQALPPAHDITAPEGEHRHDRPKWLRRRWLWASAGGAAALAVAILVAVLLTSSPSPPAANFPNPNRHPTAPSNGSVTRTYTEQEFNPGGASTFAHLDGSGAGTPVAYGQYVRVSCKVYSTIVTSTKPDGYWYRLASLPWDNHYYAVANTFGNGDKLNHPPYTHNTDWRVPNCK